MRTPVAACGGVSKAGQEGSMKVATVTEVYMYKTCRMYVEKNL